MMGHEMGLTPTPDTSGLASMTQAVEFILRGTMISVTTLKAICYSDLSWSGGTLYILVSV
jgi:hypothetical protein